MRTVILSDAEVKVETIPSKRVTAVGSLLSVVGAELLTVFVDRQVGFAAFSLLLIALFVGAAFGPHTGLRKWYLSLALVTTVRLTWLALPLDGLVHGLQYLAFGIPLVLGTTLAVQHIGLTSRQLGLRLPMETLALRRHGLIALAGLPLGILYAWVLSLPAFSPQPVTGQVGLATVLFGIGLAFVEEFIFRGMLLGAGQRIRLRGAVVYVAVLYAALQVGYQAWPAVLLSFVISLFFGWVVSKTHTVYSVAIAHGLMNVIVLLLINR